MSRDRFRPKHKSWSSCSNFAPISSDLIPLIFADLFELWRQKTTFGVVWIVRGFPLLESPVRLASNFGTNWLNCFNSWNQASVLSTCLLKCFWNGGLTDNKQDHNYCGSNCLSSWDLSLTTYMPTAHLSLQTSQIPGGNVRPIKKILNELNF